MRRLNAYYIYIHDYFPILPPAVTPIEIDNPTTWSNANTPLNLSDSPLSLAISAVLALVPLPDQRQWDPAQSTSARKSLANSFAQAALHQIEVDYELINPSAANDWGAVDDRLALVRTAFHPQTPVDLESLLALLILSNYEYAHRGNALKMAVRTSQAIITAKTMSLHRLGSETDGFSESRRRAWWMTVSTESLYVT